MKPSSKLPIDLPPAEKGFDPDLYFHTESVGGNFGVTAELSTIDNIVEYEEAIRLPQQGYYRLAMHPRLRGLQKRLKQYYGLPHAILYNSAPTALKELIDYLVIQDPGCTVCWICDQQARAHACWQDRMEHIPAPAECLPADALPNPESFTPSQVLLLAVKDPEAWVAAQPQWLAELQSRGIPVICYSPTLPASRESLIPVSYWIAGLTGKEAPEIEGGVLFTRLDEPAAEIYERNRRRGGVLSARNAAWFQGEHRVDVQQLGEALPQTAAALGRLEKAGHTFLYPSGMYALTTLVEHLRTPERGRVIVVGHLYSDTHTLLSEGQWTGGPIDSVFLRADEADRIADVLDDRVAVVFVETITNPLNEIPDLDTIIRAAHAAGVPVMVDNTMASPYNYRPLEHGADYVIESSSKYLSGANDHGGGAVLTNRPEAAARLAAAQERWRQPLSPLEARVLHQRMGDFDERMERFNRNASELAEFLEQHPAVDRVWFAGLASSPFCDTARCQLNGVGSVVSFTLTADGLEPLRTFYDPPLPGIYKAPSLGSNVTLLCPYTMLTYYFKEDAYLEDIRLPRYLVRVSVGCETSIRPVIDTLDRALRTVLEKHPAE